MRAPAWRAEPRSLLDASRNRRHHRYNHVLFVSSRAPFLLLEKRGWSLAGGKQLLIFIVFRRAWIT